jgi:TrmH family RNA methyltransferase
MASITSRSHPKIKLIRSLRQRKHRQATGLFLVEGIRHVGEALEAQADVEFLCYAPEQLTSTYARDLIRQQQQRGLTCLAVDLATFASIAEKDHPQGILAVVRKPDYQLSQLNPQNFPWGVALVSPQDPGNIGTIMRTIDAVGANGLLLLDDSADPTHPSAVRASMGTLFSYPIVQTSFTDFQAWSQIHAYHIYGTSAHGSKDYQSVEHFQRPTLLLLGSEREGLTTEQSAACELVLRLPMHGHATSLNLAVAAGVMLYAMLEQQ